MQASSTLFSPSGQIIISVLFRSIYCVNIFNYCVVNNLHLILSCDRKSTQPTVSYHARIKRDFALKSIENIYAVALAAQSDSKKTPSVLTRAVYLESFADEFRWQ